MFSFLVKGLTGPFTNALLGMIIMNIESVLIILGYDMEKEGIAPHKEKIFKWTKWIGLLYIIGAVINFLALLFTGFKGLSMFG